MLLLFPLLFAYSFALSTFQYALRYDLTCLTQNNSYACTGKSQSMEITSNIDGKGNVKTTIKKLIGSISQWDLHGVFDSKTKEGTEVGTVSFGVHTTHQDNKISYMGKVISVDPEAKDPKKVDYAGWMKVTGGTGSMKGAIGGASHSCTYEHDFGKVRCYQVGTVTLP